MLNSAGTPFDECFDALNLTQPQRVAEVHRAYIAAGADMIETNTWGANRFKLEAFGYASDVRAINMRAAKIAREEREIAGRPVYVAGSVGPTGRTLSPFGSTDPAAVRDAFREQIEGLLEGGVDCISIETIPNLAELEQALEAAFEATDLPIIAMMTFAEDERTIGGNDTEDFVRLIASTRVAVAGANCSVGPRRLLAVSEAIVSALRSRGLSTPVGCMPNAGWPAHVGGRVMYPSSPEYFATFARDARAIGVTLIGGCCGTTPAHTLAMRHALDEVVQDGVTAVAHEPRLATVVDRQTSSLLPQDEPTDFSGKLGKKFVACVEIDPPKGMNPEKALEGARFLKEVGIDAINVADSPMARVRMSAMTMCYLIQHTVGLETIIHFTTRDRSLMGLQSELLGAHAVGVRNILALTGDPPALGDYPESSGVYDVDSIGLLRVIQRMNEGFDVAGASIGKMASFTAGCAVDPTRADLSEEIGRLRQKIAAGATFVMTQPIFDVAVWTRFLELYEEPIGVPVLIGVLPLQSSRHAEFLHNEVPGITLSDEARDRMRRAGANGKREGIVFAQQLLGQLHAYAQGVYLMPSFGRYEVVAEVLEILPKSPG